MNLPKFNHSAMFIGATACGKTEFLLRLLETAYKNHFEFIIISCPTILDNKTFLSRKWIFDDKNILIVCDVEGKLNEWIKLFKSMLKGHQTLFIIDDCSAEGEINKKEIRTWGFWCSLRPLLHHTSSAHNSHSAPEPLSLSNCIKLWGKLVLVQYDANIWC